jgi:two-component system KDP operon response regulator KdpE
MTEGSILVVSEEVSFGRVLRITLAAKGYKVTNTKSVGDAVKLSDSGKYDLVLLDSDASSASAIEACREIRACSDLAIIIVSGDKSEEEKARAIRAGASAYIPKPFGATEIFTGVRENMRKVMVTVSSQPW